MMMFSPDHTVFEFMINNSRLTPQQIEQVRKATSSRPTTSPSGGRSVHPGQGRRGLPVGAGRHPGARGAAGLAPAVLDRRRHASWWPTCCWRARTADRAARGRREAGARLVRGRPAGGAAIVRPPRASSPRVALALPGRARLREDAERARVGQVDRRSATTSASSASTVSRRRSTASTTRPTASGSSTRRRRSRTASRRRTLRDDASSAASGKRRGARPPPRDQVRGAHRRRPGRRCSPSRCPSTFRPPATSSRWTPSRWHRTSRSCPSWRSPAGCRFGSRETPTTSATDGSNQHLSELRAQASRIPGDARRARERIVGRGQRAANRWPATDTPEGRAQNRRTDVLFIRSVR